jgi:hypothetical protein
VPAATGGPDVVINGADAAITGPEIASAGFTAESAWAGFDRVRVVENVCDRANKTERSIFIERKDLCSGTYAGLRLRSSPSPASAWWP